MPRSTRCCFDSCFGIRVNLFLIIKVLCPCFWTTKCNAMLLLCQKLFHQSTKTRTQTWVRKQFPCFIPNGCQFRWFSRTTTKCREQISISGLGSRALYILAYTANVYRDLRVFSAIYMEKSCKNHKEPLQSTQNRQ